MDKLFEMVGDIAMVHKKGIETGRKMILDRLPNVDEISNIIEAYSIPVAGLAKALSKRIGKE